MLSQSPQTVFSHKCSYCPGGGAVFRVKAVTSSVQRMPRYENCSGSSEAGNTDQLLKTLTEDAVRATAVIQACDLSWFWYEQNDGNTEREEETEDDCENML